jgi:hypothetical protein
MYSRFPRLRFGPMGLLLLCLGISIVGTGIADLFLRGQESRRRHSLARLARLPPFAVKSAMALGKLPWETKIFAPGSPAPDFTLPNVLDQRPVHLADFRDRKPVVLLFGSFGCDVFCGQLSRLNQLYRVYKDRAEFLFVYIKEAPHAVLPVLAKSEPKASRISRGLHYFDISFACLVGDEAVERAYDPYPLRLMIVDRDGRVAFDAGLGIPKGWNLDPVESWLEASGGVPSPN